MRTDDPVLSEIVRNALTMVVEEAGIAAARSASSPFVSAAASIACCLFDDKARLIAQTSGGLMHASALQVMLPEVLKDHPPETLKDGDALLTNHTFRGGIHPTDVGLFRPIFHAGRPAFYCGTMMIVSDLGGTSAGGLPATATECFHEGLMIPPVKVYEAGERNRSMASLIRANSRTPDRIMGDIDALVAGGNVAAARMGSLVAKYGYEKLSLIIEDLLDYAERLTRHGISQIPDGVYRGSYEVEEDGVEEGRTFKVEATITVEGDRFHLDCTGTSPQARGAINSSYSQSLSGAVFALRCYLDPTIPLNEGFYRPLSVNFPPGSLVNPQYPAACNLRLASVMAMVEAMYRAMGKAYPEKAVGACGLVGTITGHGPSLDGKRTWSILDASFGIGGGRHGLDGVDGTPFILYASSNYDRNIESYEWEFPILYKSYRLLPDSGGAGQWRGGCGLIKELEFLVEAQITMRGTDRYRKGPEGINGGKPGRPGAWILNRGRPDERVLPPKLTNLRIKAGDTMTMIAAGGGGFGDPAKRDPAAVRRDVQEGYVSREAARSEYGIEIA